MKMILPQDVLKKEANDLLRNHWEDEYGMRDNEALRAYCIPLIVEVGDVIRRHARRLGVDTGNDCALQLDLFGDAMAWALVEYIAQTRFENDTRFFFATIHQFSEAHAFSWFDWPPAPELESEAN
jgi:hypothetical protein